MPHGLTTLRWRFLQSLMISVCLLGLPQPSVAASDEVPLPMLLESENGVYIWSLSDQNEYAAVSLSPDLLSADSIAWGVDCPVDAMSDLRKCSFAFGNPVDRKDVESGLFVNFLEASTPQYVCVSRHNYPGKQAMIRVDDNPPVTTGENGCVAAAEVLPQLLAGKDVTVRHYTFPSTLPRDVKHSLLGFSQSVNVVARIHQGTLLRPN